MYSLLNTQLYSSSRMSFMVRLRVNRGRRKKCVYLELTQTGQYFIKDLEAFKHPCRAYFRELTVIITLQSVTAAAIGIPGVHRSRPAALGLIAPCVAVCGSYSHEHKGK